MKAATKALFDQLGLSEGDSGAPAGAEKSANLKMTYKVGDTDPVTITETNDGIAVVPAGSNGKTWIFEGTQLTVMIGQSYVGPGTYQAASTVAVNLYDASSGIVWSSAATGWSGTLTIVIEEGEASGSVTATGLLSMPADSTGETADVINAVFFAGS